MQEKNEGKVGKLTYNCCLGESRGDWSFQSDIYRISQLDNMDNNNGYNQWPTQNKFWIEIMINSTVTAGKKCHYITVVFWYNLS